MTAGSGGPEDAEGAGAAGGAAAHDLVPGLALAGRYELRTRVAADELAEVWAASDRVLARSVTVEILAPGAGDREREAFVAAMTAAARLAHVNIAAVYDSGSLGRLPFLVSERPAGHTLTELGPMPLGRVATVGRQLALAVDAANRSGVAHGGVDADAVTVTDDDRVKLGRFAVSGARARLAGPAATPGAPVPGPAATPGAPVPGPAATTGAPVPGPAATGPAVTGPAVTGPAVTGPAVTGPAVTGAPVPDDAVSVRATIDAACAGSDRPLLAAALAAPTLAGVAAALAELAFRDPPTPPASSPPVLPPRPSRGPVVAGVVVGLLLVAGIVATAFALVNNGSGSTGSSTQGTSSPPTGATAGGVAVTGVQSFNPFGDQPENAALTGHLIDGDPSTTWSTFEYRDARFGNLKPGTGVVLTLAKAQPLHTLTVTSPSRGWSLSVYVATSPASTLAGWGKAVATSSAVSGDVTQVDLGGAPGGAVLVWITDLGAPAAHSSTYPYRVDIGELTVR